MFQSILQGFDFCDTKLEKFTEFFTLGLTKIQAQFIQMSKIGFYQNLL
jgi:hypothetical protein